MMCNNFLINVAVLLLFLLHLATTETHHSCPLGCNCDFENGFKRVRCEVVDSSININFNKLDSDIQFLEILPGQRGQKDGFGPVIPDAFQDFPKLTRLVIRNNGIKRIPLNTARQLSKLETLDLAGNEIRSFRDLSLDSFTNLQTLQLSNNDIDSINDDSLRVLTNLRSLALNSNQIGTISNGAFQSQELLEQLMLRNNRLTDFPKGALDSISRLQNLDLSGNQFTSVPPGVQRLLGLSILSLDGNKISSIPSSLVQAWRSSGALTSVSLYKNPLQCDASLADFITWIKSTDGFKKVCNIANAGGCPTCDSPRAVAGKTIDSVNVGRGSQSRDQLANRPASGTDDYSMFQVVDPVRVPSDFNPRRDVQRPNAANNQMATKLQQFMPNAGVRCGQQSCYYFSAKGTTEWRTAEFICQNIGLDLVEIGSAAEQQELMRLLVEAVKENPTRQSRSRGWWTGMKYDPTTHTVISAASGRTLPFTNWVQGQPNDFATSQSCVELWDTGDWNDGRCNLPMESQFICESSLAVGQGLAQHENPGKFTILSGGSGKRVSGSSSIQGGFASSDTVSFTVIN